MGVRQETQAAKACVFCFKSLPGNYLSLKSGFVARAIQNMAKLDPPLYMAIMAI
jgi:hypothetical protein